MKFKKDKKTEFFSNIVLCDLKANIRGRHHRLSTTGLLHVQIQRELHHLSLEWRFKVGAGIRRLRGWRTCRCGQPSQLDRRTVSERLCCQVCGDELDEPAVVAYARSHHRTREHQWPRTEHVLFLDNILSLILILTKLLIESTRTTIKYISSENTCKPKKDRSAKVDLTEVSKLMEIFLFSLFIRLIYIKLLSCQKL